MTKIVQVKKKAQITLPKEVREQLQIREGDILEVRVEKQAVVLRPRLSDRVSVKFAPAKSLKGLADLISVGGDAVKDSEETYDG